MRIAIVALAVIFLPCVTMGQEQDDLKTDLVRKIHRHEEIRKMDLTDGSHGHPCKTDSLYLDSDVRCISK